MKQFLPVVWWLTATLVIAFVLVGLGYLFADALLLGVLFLPGMLTARYFVPQLSFENRRQGILDTVYLALAILGIEYLRHTLELQSVIFDYTLSDKLCCGATIFHLIEIKVTAIGNI